MRHVTYIEEYRGYTKICETCHIYSGIKEIYQNMNSIYFTWKRYTVFELNGGSKEMGESTVRNKCQSKRERDKAREEQDGERERGLAEVSSLRRHLRAALLYLPITCSSLTSTPHLSTSHIHYPIHTTSIHITHPLSHPHHIYPHHTSIILHYPIHTNFGVTNLPPLR